MSLSVRTLGWVAAVSLIGLGMAGGSSAAGLQNSAWPMLHRNAEHEGRSQAPISMSPTILWSQPLADSAEFSSPAIDVQGNVYIGDVGDRLTKFDPAGNLVWNFDTGGNLRRSSPAIAADGTVYVGSSDGRLLAVNPNGTQRWAFTAGGPIKTSPTIGVDGSVYFGADNGVFYSVSSAGALNWSYATGDTIRSSPAILTDTLVVVGSNDGGVYAFQTDGTFRWSGFTGGPVKAGITVGQGDDIFVASQDGFLYALRRHGALNWSIFTDGTLRSTPSIGITGDILVANSNEIWCYGDAGDTCWVATVGGRILSSPIVHTDPSDSTETVIVGAEDGVLYGVQDGTIVWSVTIGAPINSTAAIGADGTIYVGANDGRIYAIGEASTDVAGTGPYAPMLEVGPNPSRFGQSVRFRSPAGEDGTVLVLDAVGRRVGRVELEGGSGSWDGRSESGRSVAPGVYFYRWESRDAAEGGRIVRVR